TSLVFIPILLALTYIGGITMRYIAFLGGVIILAGLMMVLPLWQETILNGAFPALMIFRNPRFILFSVVVLALISGIALYGFRRYKKPYFFWICYAASMLIISL
ncbi:MAG: rod shape-determining protein RodA, partial [Treponema sp.]|nr:rod shape-determining protein RodA [Treponema sp.]